MVKWLIIQPDFYIHFKWIFNNNSPSETEALSDKMPSILHIVPISEVNQFCRFIVLFKNESQVESNYENDIASEYVAKIVLN